MSTAASFEFRHIRRHLKPEETIPAMPSLLQQVEALVDNIREARNQPQCEDDDPLMASIGPADIDPIDEEDA